MRLRLAAALTLAATCLFAQEEDPIFDPAWSTAPVWDDGLCEVAHFDAVTFYEGREWEHEVTMITCAEILSRTFHVKVDVPEAEDIGAIKSNLVFAAPTGAYETRVMSSVFVRRDDPGSLLKQAVSTQEWCGTSFFEVRGWTDPMSLLWHTYWDGEGDGERAFDMGVPVMSTEQLLVSLRSLRFQDEPHFQISLLDPLIHARLGGNAVRPAEVEGLPYLAPIESPTGEEAWRVRVTPEGGATMELWFQPAPPHALMHFEAPEAEGLRRLDLREVARERYW